MCLFIEKLFRRKELITANHYPQELSLFVSELFNEKGMLMKAVLPLVDSKFPAFAGKLDLKHLYSIAYMAKKKQQKHAKQLSFLPVQSKSVQRRVALMQKPDKVLPTNEMPKDTQIDKKEMIETARVLHNSGYRWGAIVAELKSRYPEHKMPNAGLLSRLVKGKSATIYKNGHSCKVTLEAPTGTVLTLEISSKRAEQLLKELVLWYCETNNENR